ncbi:hypothetical protein WMF26_44235 [Sorangium sp. So ce185]|uniref:hypothetical protein n=1 Tax=Sorangium sp. So ce185 TaxID=3133287 RepID=UPI003F5F2219
MSVHENEQELSRALYDGAGERRVHLHRVAGEEETAYVDQHLVVRNGVTATKHIFAGEPTPVGELVVAGAVVVGSIGYAGYLIYEAAANGDPPKPPESFPIPGDTPNETAAPLPPPPAAGGGGAKEPPKPAVAAAAEPPQRPSKRQGEDASRAASRIDPTKPAREVLPGSLRREFPGKHLDKSLNGIKDALRTESGAEKRSLQTAKKILEQSERLLEKTKSE